MFLSGALPSDQTKPSGAQQIDTGNSIADGLIFYGLDNGNGTFTNLCAGPAMQAGSVALSGESTPYGTATLFPGLTLQGGNHLPGEAVYRSVTDSIDVVAASNLRALGIGEGVTFACGCLRKTGVIGALNEWIFGRPGVSAGEGPIPVSSGFIEALPPDGNYQVSCKILHNPSGGDSSEVQYKIGDSYTFTPEQFTSFLCSTVNTSASPGTGTSKFYAQGALVGSATTGVSMWSYNPFNVAETEIMFGGLYHTDTGMFICAFGGYVYYGAFWNRALSAVEAASLHADPYQVLMPA